MNEDYLFVARRSAACTTALRTPAAAVLASSAVPPGPSPLATARRARISDAVRRGASELAATGRRLVAAGRPHGIALALGAILLLAFSLRAETGKRGLPYLHHWDEPFIANRALQILRSGDYNPHFFSYGSLIIYAHAGVDALHYLSLAKLPDDDPSALRDPTAIRFHGAREDWLAGDPEHEPYWVSHPSFYLWNRRLTALFGTLAVALTFALTRRLARRNGVAGGDESAAAFGALAAAFVLATSTFHVEHSAWITTDVPATTLALAGLLGTLVFVDGGGPRALLLAGAALGLATSTKYNTAVFAAIPAGALAVAAWRRARGYRPWLWLAVPGVAAAAFLLATPYAVLDLPAFLRDTGRMLYSYLGNRDQMVPITPGWPHLRLDLALLGENLGLGVALGALGGLVLGLRRARSWVVLPIAPLVIWATSGTRAPFHRNLIVCYPIAAMAFGLAVAWALSGGARSRRRQAIAVLLLLATLPPAARGIADARRVGGARDTRSRAIDRLDELGRSYVASVGIARELNVHGLDLARLEIPYTVRPLQDLVCSPGDEAALLLPSRPWATSPGAKAEAERLDALRRGAGALAGSLAADQIFTVDSPAVDPGLELRRPLLRGALALPCVRGGIPFSTLHLQGESGLNRQSLGLAPGASATSPALAFPEGSALVSLRLAAVEAAGAEIELVAREAGPDPARELARWPLRSGTNPTVHELALPLARPTALSLELVVRRESPGGALLYGLWVDSAPGGTEKGPV